MAEVSFPGFVAGFVSADALGVGAGAGSEGGLGPVVFFSESFDEARVKSGNIGLV